MRLLVCGSRKWKDEDLIREWLWKIHSNRRITCVIHGRANGADSIAASIASKMGIPVEGYSADWDKHGKAAGSIRNKQMLVEGKPDAVIAFFDAKTPGTMDMLRRAQKARLETYTVGHELSTHYCPGPALHKLSGSDLAQRHRRGEG